MLKFSLSIHAATMIVPRMDVFKKVPFKNKQTRSSSLYHNTDTFALKVFEEKQKKNRILS